MQFHLTSGASFGDGYGNDNGGGNGHGGDGYGNGYGNGHGGYGFGDGGNGIARVNNHIHPRVSADNDLTVAIHTAQLNLLIHRR